MNISENSNLNSNFSFIRGPGVPFSVPDDHPNCLPDNQPTEEDLCYIVRRTRFVHNFSIKKCKEPLKKLTCDECSLSTSDYIYYCSTDVVIESNIVIDLHRRAFLLQQPSSITVYDLPTKENKLPFSVSVCNKQSQVCYSHFLFAANKRKLLFFR